MVRIYTKNIRLEEPVKALFVCEFCKNEFTREGIISVDQKVETWYRNISDTDISTSIEIARAKIHQAQEVIETNLNAGSLVQNWSEKDIKIHFNGGSRCPTCNYQQQIAPRKAWETKRKISLIVFLIMPIAIYATILYAAIAAYIENNSLIALSMAIVLVALLPIGYFLVTRVRSPNKVFMKKHALTKKNLPAPLKPIISYDSIKIINI